MEGQCPKCDADVLIAFLTEESKSADKRGDRSPVVILVDPEPRYDGNVAILGNNCAFVNGSRPPGLPLYRRHGLTCTNPYMLRNRGDR